MRARARAVELHCRLLANECPPNARARGFSSYAIARVRSLPKARMNHARKPPFLTDGCGVERHRQLALNRREHSRAVAAPAVAWTEKLKFRCTAPLLNQESRERAPRRSRSSQARKSGAEFLNSV